MSDGNRRVEEFMAPIEQALERRDITGEARTDIFNRAYEAVDKALRKYGANEVPTKGV